MPHYGILRDYKLENIEDVRDAGIYGLNNEKLGTIDDVIFDHSSGEIRYAVVKTSELLSSKKFLVPIDRIQQYGEHEDMFYTELDKEHLRMLPEFNDAALKSENHWTDYEQRYQQRWNEGAVMYNQDTGRIVTPPISEVRGTRTAPLSEEAKRSLSHDFTPQKVGRQDDYLGVGSASHDVTLRPRKPSIGSREDVLLQQQGTSHEKKVSSDQPPKGPSIEDPPRPREPGVYLLDAVPDAEKKSDMNEPPNANYRRRWQDFQEKLREGRDKIVGNCPLCGTQQKIA
jgi:sporulation protein YlmC with PRC-barrel domain